jgi:hypothetical protein
MNEEEVKDRLEETHAIIMHLKSIWTSEERNVFSAYTGALRDARLITNRNVEDGSKLDGKPHSSWLGLSGYLMLLDHIGHCLEPRSPKVSPKSDGKIPEFQTALWQFSSELSWTEIQALYALRCAIFHGYSLYNFKTDRPELCHYFTLTDDKRAPLLKLPPQPWDGDFSQSVSEKFMTVVNVEKVGDLVEGINKQLFDLAKVTELRVAKHFEGGLAAFRMMLYFTHSGGWAFDRMRGLVKVDDSQSGVSGIFGYGGVEIQVKSDKDKSSD